MSLNERTRQLRSIAVAAVTLFGVTGVFVGALGCESAGPDLREALNINAPTPSEAASWMFHRDAERRRLGITLISNASFGGEQVYLDVYREAVSDVDALVRAAAAHALGLHGEPPDAVALARLLSDESRHVRWEAAKALQRIHHPEAVAPLISTMSQDADVDVRMAAANALGQYAEPRVVEALIAALDDSSLAVNHHALRSLRLLTGQEFGYEPSAWLSWYRRASDAFAGREPYMYPVFHRDLRFLEQVFPINRPQFEEPAPPVGLAPEVATAPAPANDEASEPPAPPQP